MRGLPGSARDAASRPLVATALVAGGAFAVRAAWVLATAGTGPLFDKYFWLARRLQGVGWVPDVAFSASPLYSYLVAFLTLGLGWGETGIRLLQAAAGALAVVLAWRAFRLLADEATAAVGAALLALHPTLVLYDAQPLPEAWSNLVNAALLLLLVRPWTEGPARPGAAAGAGALIGLSALLRPTGLLWLPLLAWRLIETRGRGPAAAARAGAAALLACALVLAPAAWVNWRAEHRLILSTTSGGLNLYNGNSHANRGYTFLFPPSVQHLQGTIVGDTIRQPATPEIVAWQRAAGWAVGRELTLQESSDFWTGEVRRYAAREPLAFLRGLARKARFFLHAHEPHDTESAVARARVLGGIPFGFAALFWALALVGMALSLPAWRAALAPFWLFATVLGSCTLFYVSSRLRSPALLPAAYFAACAVRLGLEAATQRRTRRAAALGAAALAGLAFAAWPHAAVEEMRRSQEVSIAFVEPGLERYRRGDVAGGIELLRRGIERAPLLAGAVAAQIEGLAADPASLAFLERLNEIVVTTPRDANDARVKERIGAMARDWREGRPAEAMAQLEAAIALDPWNWDLYNARARMHRVAGRWEQALADYERAFALGRNVAAEVGTAWYEMGLCALQAGRREQARDYARRALFVDPASAEARALLARAGA